MAGLCAARVLAERFEQVLVVDRDNLPEEAEWRGQVPQGRHQHVLLPAGARILDGWFPGLLAEVEEAGGVPIDLSGDFAWHRAGGPWRRPPSSLRSVSMSRPLVETAVRHRVEDLPGVTVRGDEPVTGLEFDSAWSRITGVVLADRSVDAGLVVDATGRRCQTLNWLEDLGYEPPPVTRVEVGIRYVTQVYERSEVPARDWEAAFVVGDPTTRRMAAAVPFEDDRWFVLLSGVNGEEPPTDRDEALEWVRSLDSPMIAEVMEASRPVGEPVTHRFPTEQRRHFDRLRHYPLGWVPIGDAVCSFNPLYGQGMTVAAQQAEALGVELDRRDDVDRMFARRYFRALRRITEDPWQIAVGGDFAYGGTSGPKPRGTDQMGRYLARLAVAAQHDDLIALRLKEVASLERSPRSLLSPRALVRGLRAARRGPLNDSSRTSGLRSQRGQPDGNQGGEKEPVGH